MSDNNKISNAAEETWGKAKEKTGEVTGNEDLAAEGAADQAEANAKQAGEHVKDAAHDAGDAVNEAFKR